jgi:hypothetical protein
MMQRSLLSSLVIQICLAVLAVAAPVAEETLTTTKHGHLGFGTGGGILGLVVFILDIIIIGTLRLITPELCAASECRT